MKEFEKWFRKAENDLFFIRNNLFFKICAKKPNK